MNNNAWMNAVAHQQTRQRVRKLGPHNLPYENQCEWLVSRMSAKPLNFKLGDHTFDVVDEFTSVSPSPRTWALTQKSPEESAKICLKLRLLFDVNFHGESGRADESWIFVSMIRLFCSVIRSGFCLSSLFRKGKTMRRSWVGWSLQRTPKSLMLIMSHGTLS